MRDHLMEELQPLRPYFHSRVSVVAPVRLPLGRLRLSTSPRSTGSPAVKKTIGIVFVAAFAARAEGVVGATITATWRRTSSTADAGNLLFRPSAQRYAIATFWPALHPVAFNPTRYARSRTAYASGESLRMNPTVGIFAGCCARAASGHTAAPPSIVMNSRRLARNSIQKIPVESMTAVSSMQVRAAHSNSFDHLVGAREQHRRNFESDALCGPQVDHQLELRRLNDRQIGGPGAFEDATCINPNQPVRLGVAWSVASQATGFGGLAKVIQSRDPMVIGQCQRLIAPADQEWIGVHH